MSLLVKKNGREGLMPSLFDNFLDTDRFFVPSLFRDDRFFDFDNTLVVPEANIMENEKDFTIEIAAPGLDRKDFKVEVKEGMLCVSAEKEEEKKEEKKNYYKREFSYNSFSRSFKLPENTLADKIDAKYENGILKLMLPKKEVVVEKPSKKIPVS